MGLSKIRDCFAKAAESQTPPPAFLDTMFKAFTSIFPSMECFDFSVQSLVTLTKLCNFSWRIHLLGVLAAVVKCVLAALALPDSALLGQELSAQL